MNRREFLRNAAIIAGGAIAADQIELLERLVPRRLLVPGFGPGLWESNRVYTNGRPFGIDLLRESNFRIWETPFKADTHVMGKNERYLWEIALR